jgi:hypothetical protein
LKKIGQGIAYLKNYLYLCQALINKTIRVMFTILLKRVQSKEFGKIEFNRYFKSWSKAKKVMDEEVNNRINSGATIKRSLDRMNIEKGFYEYEVILKPRENEPITEVSYALIDGYFQDE